MLSILSGGLSFGGKNGITIFYGCNNYIYAH